MYKKCRRKTSNLDKRQNVPESKPTASFKSIFMNKIWREHHFRTSSLDWPPACLLVRRAKAPYNFSRRKHEEAKGFLSYRIADRRGDHSDHRGHRHSELAALENRSQRIIRCGRGSHHRHRGSDVFFQLGQWFRHQFDFSWRTRSLQRSDCRRSLSNRLAFERCSLHQERLYIQRRRNEASWHRVQRIRSERVAIDEPDDRCALLLRRPDGRAQVCG